MIILSINFLLGFASIYDAQNINLVNTKWIFIFNDCQDFIEFSRKEYKLYSCETEDTTYGNYFHRDNEVILDQLQGSFDEDFPKDDPHRTQREKYKLIITGNKMHYVEKWDLNIWGKWEKSDFKFSEEYVFEKVESK